MTTFPESPQLRSLSEVDQSRQMHEEVQGSNPIVTCAEFISWLKDQSGVVAHPVRTYCEQRFDSRQVTVWPKEIRVSFRYAWSDTYTPDAELEALIGKLQARRRWAVEDVLETRLKAVVAKTDHVTIDEETRRRCA